LRREGKTTKRFTITAPRVMGTKHGIGQGSALATTSLHEYALRSKTVAATNQWCQVLHCFLEGMYSKRRSEQM